MLTTAERISGGHSPVHGITVGYLDSTLAGGTNHNCWVTRQHTSRGTNHSPVHGITVWYLDSTLPGGKNHHCWVHRQHTSRGDKSFSGPRHHCWVPRQHTTRVDKSSLLGTQSAHYQGGQIITVWYLDSTLTGRKIITVRYLDSILTGRTNHNCWVPRQHTNREDKSFSGPRHHCWVPRQHTMYKGGKIVYCS